ncbi:MAG: ECF transporter S component [Candidatus Limnocylindrales bacterium]
MTTPATAADPAIPATTRWRTLDIVITAVIGVVFGVVFWLWDLVWSGAQPIFAGAPQLEYVISGIWLLPAVLAPMIVRKPGAALFAEVMAAAVSALLGNTWGLDVILSGFVQGAGAELVFAFGLYRSFTLRTAVLAGAAAALGEVLHDLPIYYPSAQFGPDVQLAILVAAVASGAVLAGLVGWYLLQALRGTGVIDAFPGGA